ncbi:MAG: putative cardiolipin synthase [Halieaceae bacterium]|jgi:putative cardiolipin synthase
MKQQLVGIVAGLLLLGGCASAPFDYPKVASFAPTDTGNTWHAANVEHWLDGRKDVNGFYPLSRGFDAFGARLALMERAETTIDAQYFLMKPDYAGLVFAGSLLQAADRGVKVRLLLDDIFTTVADIDLAMLDAHPNIELRLFNPIARKGLFALNYLGNFSLANRRMHNKAFIADNEVAVVGGRNIAAEYFQLQSTGEFLDFDMLTAGPVVRDVSDQFDTYWNHELALPMAAFYTDKDTARIAASRASMLEHIEVAGRSIYGDAVNTPLLQQFYADELPPYVADARLLVDSPQKLLEKVSPQHQQVVNDLRDAFSAAESEIIIFTPYFIPGKSGVELIRSVRARGVRVVLLTNSLATNNHTSVHSSYSSYRKDLLKVGVELWEARVDAATITSDEGEPQLEKLTLHTKGILIDRKRVFVGSLNLDPRSIDINTEMGLLIDSPALAKTLSESSLANLPRIAYRLQLDHDDKISWHATIDGEEVVEMTEPQTTAWRRLSAWFQKIVPEKQL